MRAAHRARTARPDCKIAMAVSSQHTARTGPVALLNRPGVDPFWTATEDLWLDEPDLQLRREQKPICAPVCQKRAMVGACRALLELASSFCKCAVRAENATMEHVRALPLELMSRVTFSDLPLPSEHFNPFHEHQLTVKHSSAHLYAVSHRFQGSSARRRCCCNQGFFGLERLRRHYLPPVAASGEKDES